MGVAEEPGRAVRPTGRLKPGEAYALLIQTNPWWKTSNWQSSDPQISEADRSRLNYLPALLNDIAPGTVYLLLGPRRVGKSTLVKQRILRMLSGEKVDPRTVCYFPLDKLSSRQEIGTIFGAAKSLLKRGPHFFFFDEVSRIEEWAVEIKWLRDNDSVASLACFVITSSSSKDLTEAQGPLAGRRGDVLDSDRVLLPLSFPAFVAHLDPEIPPSPRFTLEDLLSRPAELLGDGLVHLDVLQRLFMQYLRSGGFPRAVAEYRDERDVSDAFVRDLWQVLADDLIASGLRNLSQTRRLVGLLAENLCSTVSWNSLGRLLDADNETIRRHVDNLARAYACWVLYQQDKGSPQLNAARKVYFWDPLVAMLHGRTDGSPRRSDEQLAQMVVGTTLMRAAPTTPGSRLLPSEGVFLFRKNGREVDFEIVLEGRRIGIETKYVDEVREADFRLLRASFESGVVITHGEVDFRPPILRIPASLFAWALGHRI